MRAAARRAAPCLLLLATARVAAAADAGAYLYTRPLDVPAAGRVVAPLDVAALRHLFGGSPAVFAPDGSEVPSRLGSDVTGRQVKADLVEALREGESWRLVLDLGPEPPLHEQLHFRLLRVTAAAAVRLEGSDDRATWRPLAEGNLFRLGSSDELERTALVYPPNRHRWLRLTWPAAAGTPELRRIEVGGALAPTLAVSAAAPACRSEGAAAVCALPLPAPHQVGLRLDLRFAADGRGPGGRVGYRLSRPFIGRWQKLSEGTAPVASGALAVPLPPEPLSGEPLRLELYGDPAPPRLAGWTLELAEPVVVFAAPRAGRYTLAYGGGVAPELAPAVGGGVVLAVLGPERRQTLPPLPPAATAPGAALDAKAFAASWPVRAPRARAGDVVRLEPPAGVLSTAAVDLFNVRLAVGGRQLPFLRLELDTPALVAARPGLRPRPERRSRKSRVDVAVGREQSFSSLSLVAAPPFRRWVAVSQRYAVLPIRKREVESERGYWDCAAQPPLLCRWEAAASNVLPIDRLSVRFDDGDNPPLPSVDVALWRQRHWLVFVWPAAGEVRLLSGAREPTLAAPRYDLELLAPQLLARPWRAATVDAGGGTRGEERGPAWLPLLIPAVLALAAVVLIAILAQVIGKRP